MPRGKRKAKGGAASPSGAEPTPMGELGEAFFKTLSESQRAKLAALASVSEAEQFEVGKALVAAAVRSLAKPEGNPLDALGAAGGTGPALVAFGQRAVRHRYITQDQLDRLASRIVSSDDVEAEAVAGIRRFIACMQPLMDVVLVGCPTRHKSCPRVDPNGRRAVMNSNAPPGGNPERYNVARELSDRVDRLDDLEDGLLGRPVERLRLVEERAVVRRVEHDLERLATRLCRSRVADFDATRGWSARPPRWEGQGGRADLRLGLALLALLDAVVYGDGDAEDDLVDARLGDGRVDV